MSNLSLLTIDDYYYYPYDKKSETKWRPDRDMVRVLVGVRGCVSRPMGHSLVTLFFLSVALDSSQVTYLLSWAHTCLWGREGSLLSCCGFQLFPDWLIEGRDGGGLSTTLSPGLTCGGLESKFGRGRRPLDRRVVGWFCLCLWYKRACVLGYLARIYWFTNRRVIRYGLAMI